MTAAWNLGSFSNLNDGDHNRLPAAPSAGSNEAGRPGFRPSAARTALEVLAVAAIAGALLWGVFSLANRSLSLIVPLIPIDVDEALGDLSYRQLSLTLVPCTNLALERYLRDLSQPLFAAAGTDTSFELTVVEDDEVNAFALPGGRIIVNSGLLKRATTGEAIAGVLAHEIAHVTQRHSMRRALRQVGVTGLLSLVFGGTELAVPVGMLSGLGTAKYDRDEESEADKLGLELLIAARIAPDKLADFLGGLKTDGAQLPTFLASHPDPGDRARALRALLPTGPATVALPAPPQAACR